MNVSVLKCRADTALLTAATAGLIGFPAGLKFENSDLKFSPINLKFENSDLKFENSDLKFENFNLKFSPADLNAAGFSFLSFPIFGKADFYIAVFPKRAKRVKRAKPRLWETIKRPKFREMNSYLLLRRIYGSSNRLDAHGPCENPGHGA
jgi:hypothetical protein